MHTREVAGIEKNTSSTPVSDIGPPADPVGESLRHRHAHLARRLGRASAYRSGVATFAAVDSDQDPRRWDDLAQLVGPGELADMFSSTAEPPADWEPVFHLDGFQMIYDEDEPRGHTSVDVVELGSKDLPAMLHLVALTRPGPFFSQTPEMGTYIGIRENGALVAMAGERLRPPGWTEISAVCTAPGAQGRGYASQLVTALVTSIMARGDRPFLHVIKSNTAAVSLYERLGFRVREQVTFRGFRIPPAPHTQEQ